MTSAEVGHSWDGLEYTGTWWPRGLYHGFTISSFVQWSVASHLFHLLHWCCFYWSLWLSAMPGSEHCPRFLDASWQLSSKSWIRTQGVVIQPLGTLVWGSSRVCLSTILPVFFIMFSFLRAFSSVFLACSGVHEFDKNTPWTFCTISKVHNFWTNWLIFKQFFLFESLFFSLFIKHTISG